MDEQIARPRRTPARCDQPRAGAVEGLTPARDRSPDRHRSLGRDHGTGLPTRRRARDRAVDRDGDGAVGRCRGGRDGGPRRWRSTVFETSVCCRRRVVVARRPHALALDGRDRDVPPPRVALHGRRRHPDGDRRPSALRPGARRSASAGSPGRRRRARARGDGHRDPARRRRPRRTRAHRIASAAARSSTSAAASCRPPTSNLESRFLELVHDRRTARAGMSGRPMTRTTRLDRYGRLRVARPRLVVETDGRRVPRQRHRP